ncbi:MAG: AAA family ATPase [Halovenus sp.]
MAGPDGTAGDGQRLVVLCGLPGVGKSTVAAMVTETLGATRLRTDVVRKELFAEPAYSETETEQVYEGLYERARDRLEAGESVVLDATFARREYRSMSRELAATYDVSFSLVKVVCEASVVERRLADREGVSDADRKVYRQFREEFEPIGVDHAVVDNSGTPAETRAQVEALF